MIKFLRGSYLLFFIAAMTMVLAAPLQSHALARGIAVIKSADIAPYNDALRGFKAIIPESVVEYTLKFDEERSAYLDNDEALDRCNLIFALGADALMYARKHRSNTPVIYAFVLYPEKVLKPADRSGPGIVGINMSIPPDIQLKTLVASAPGIANVGVIYDPSKTQALIDSATQVARELNINLVARKVTEKTEAINALTAMRDKVDALWMVPDTTAVTRESMEYMLLVAANGRIPLIGLSEKYVKSGALFAYSFDIGDMGHQAGELAKRMLSGGAQGEERTIRPRKFKLSMNLGIAKKLGLQIPATLIDSADNLY